MTFETISSLNKASDTHTHQTLDVSGYRRKIDEYGNESSEFEQEFVMIIPKGDQFLYFSEAPVSGTFGPRQYELIMTSSVNLAG